MKKAILLLVLIVTVILCAIAIAEEDPLFIARYTASTQIRVGNFNEAVMVESLEVNYPQCGG